MIKKTISLFILSCIIVAYACAQSVTKVTVFKPTTETEDYGKDSKAKIVDKNNVKWNYSLLGRGVFLLNYEFFIDNKLTGEAGLGMTYIDPIFEGFKGNSYGISYSGNPQVKICEEFCLRFYPKGFDNFEGFYLSPGISYRTYRFVPEQSYTGINTDAIKFGYNFFDLQLKLGYQYENVWDSDILGDFYVGFGYRNATIQGIKEQQNQTTGQYTYASASKKDAYPFPMLGLKVGFPF